MKKKIFVVGIALLLVLLTGCSKKEQVLECTISGEASSLAYTQDMKAKFVGNKVTKIDMAMKFDTTKIEEVYQNNANVLYDALESEYKAQFGVEGAEVKTAKENGNFTVYINLDLDKIKEEDKKTLQIEDQYGTYKDTKKQMEESGYTCK